MASIGPTTDTGKGIGSQRPATGLFIDDNGDPILSVGVERVYIDETAFSITREEGAIVIRESVGGIFKVVAEAEVD